MDELGVTGKIVAADINTSSSAFQKADVGEIVDLKITDTSEYDLIGEICEK